MFKKITVLKNQNFQTIFLGNIVTKGLPGLCSGKESACQCRKCKKSRFSPWVGKVPWRRKWQPSPIFCLENSMDRGAWQAIQSMELQSQTRLSIHTQVLNTQPVKKSPSCKMSLITTTVFLFQQKDGLIFILQYLDSILPI